jgi:hypothetical protein
LITFSADTRATLTRNEASSAFSPYSPPTPAWRRPWSSLPGSLFGDLPTALDAVRAVGRPDFRLLIDTMRLVRSGSGADDIAALSPDVIGYM